MAHKEVKPSNIHLVNPLQPILSNFRTFTGPSSLKYRAPEALAVNEAMTDMNGKIMNDDTGTDWFKVDMWSLGLIVYEMSTLGKAYKFESEEMYRSNLTSSKF